MDLESNLSKVDIRHIKLTHTLFFPIYMKRGNKFIPCITEGSVFDEQARNNLIAKGIDEVYIENSLINIHTIHSATKELSQKEEELDKKSEFIYKSASDIVENLFENPTRENIQKSKEVVNGILDEILSDEKVFSSLLKVTSYDYYTYSHSVNVSVYALGLGKYIGLPKKELELLGQAAILHDIGKSKVDSALINKNGKLTDDEFKTVKQHPQFGYDIMSQFKNIDMKILYGIRHHHEKLNGKGYPDRLKAKQIHPFAQIIALADIFDALTTRRSYKEAMSTFDAFKLMKDKMGDELNQKLLNSFIVLMSK